MKINFTDNLKGLKIFSPDLNKERMKIFSPNALILLLFLLSGFTLPHKFYTSITQIAYNKETKSAEIIMNVFADDWEIALSKFHHRKVTMTDATIAKLSLPYLQQYFQVQSSKEKLKPYVIIGIELKENTAEIYIEQAMSKPFTGCKILQNVLIEDFENQVNIVNLSNGSQKATLVFKKGQEDSQKVVLH